MHHSRELRHFLLLDPESQRAAIARLAASGMSESAIAAATSLSVEQIRRALAEQKGLSAETVSV